MLAEPGLPDRPWTLRTGTEYTSAHAYAGLAILAALLFVALLFDADRWRTVWVA